MNAGEHLETELKIPVVDLQGVRSALAGMGATRIHPPRRERNLVLDSAGGRLKSSGQVLRLRTVGDRHLLTLKGPPTFHGSIKERRELELEVADSAIMAAILEELGLQPVVRYEKDREDWRTGAVVVSLDHTPMGEFVELEGEEGRLGEVAAALGLDPATAVPGSYLELWGDYRRRHPELDLPRDMVFRA